MSLSSKINYAFEALSGITVGNINITGNIFQNNNPYIASQWTSTSGNALTYTSGNVIISNGSLVASNLTTGNINFTGTLSQNGSPYIGSQWTGTSGTLYYGTAGSSVVGINTTAPTFTLDVNGSVRFSTGGSIIALNNTSINITSSNLNITGTATNISAATLNINSGTAINITGASVRFSSGSVQLIGATLTTISNLVSSNITATTLLAGTNVSTASLQASTGSIGNLSAGNINLSGNLNVAGTLTVVNITSTNLVDTNITATGLRVTGTTSVANIYSSLGTISNIVSTNLSTSTLLVSSNMVTPRVDIGGTQPIYNNNTLGKLFITGNQNSVTGGPNILITTTQDNFPTYNFLTYGHDSAWTMYDMYFDGSFRNSSTATAFMMVKENSTLKWNYNTSGFSAGATAPVSTSICIGSSGNVGLGGQVTPAYTLDVTGSARISSGITAGASTFTSVSSGDSQFSNLSAGNINFTGNLFQNGSAYIGSQWVGTSGNIYFGTAGSSVVGINTTSPSTTLDVTGTGRITTSLTTGALYSTNQTTTNIVSTNLSTGTLNASTISTAILTASTSITTGTIRVTGNADLSTGLTTVTDLTGTNITSGTIRASTLISTANLATNNFSSGTIRATTLITSANITTNNFTAGTIRSTNILTSNITTSNIIVNGTSTSTNSSSGSVVLQGGLSIDEPTNATSVSNGGALTIAGGAAIAGDLIVGGSILYSNAAAASSTFAYLTLTASDWSTDVANGSLVVYGGISVQNTANATSASSGNGLTIAGGAGIGADLYVGGTGYLPNIVSTTNTTTNLVATGISASNINVSGTLTVVNITSTNLAETNITTATIQATTGITSAALLVTGLASTANLTSTTSTFPNTVSTNVSTATIRASTGITSAALLVTGLVSAANVFATTSTIPNTISTNVSTSTIRASTGITSAALLVTGLVSAANVFATTSTIPNIVHTNITTTSILVTNGSIIATFNSNTLGNVFTTGGNVGIGTTSPAYNLDVVGSGDFSTFVTTGTLYSTNQIVTNLTSSIIQATGITTGTIRVTGNADLSTGLTTVTDLTGTNQTTTNIIVTNLTSSIIQATGITTGTIRVTGNADLSTGLTTVTDLTGTNITTGTIRASTLISTSNLSSGTSTIATLLNTNAVSTNISTATLRASTGITSGALLVIGLTSTANLASTTSTLPNMVSTNITVATLNSTTGITSAALLVTGLVSAANVFATTSTLPNTLSTNITVATLNSSTGITTGTIRVTGNADLSTGLTTVTDLTGTNQTITNIIVTNLTSSIIQATGITTGTIRVTGNADLSTGLTTVTDLTGTNITSGTIRASTLISTANLGANNISSGTIRASTLISTANLSTNNLTATNLLATASTITNLSIPGTLTVVNITSTNLVETNISAATILVSGGTLNATFNSNTIGSIFTTGGNVGIGNTTPNALLHVTGNAGTDVGVFNTLQGSGSIAFRPNATAGNVIRYGGSGTGNNILRFLGVSDTEYMRIDTGNVGIGTTSPSNTLDISGTARITTSLTTGALYSTNQTTTNIVATNLTASSIIITSGNLTIGGSANPTITLLSNSGSATNAGDIKWLESNSAYGWIQRHNASTGDRLLFIRLNNNTESSLMTLHGIDQRVGILTTSPAYTLDVNGSGDFSTFVTTGALYSTNQTTTNIVSTAISSGNVIVNNNLNISGISSFFGGSFSANNNVTSASTVTSLLFPSATVRSFIATLNINISKPSGNLNSTVTLEGTQLDSGWILYDSALGDSTGLVFTINSSGQILYTSPNYIGWVSTTIRFEAHYYTLAGTYTPVTLPTSGSIVLSGDLSVTNTANATSTSSGALTVSGGAGISKSLLVGENLNVGGLSNTFTGSFAAANNVAAATNVTGFLVPTATFSSFTANVNVRLLTTLTTLNAQYIFEATQSTGGWLLNDTSFGDSVGITFTITSTGQIQYTSTNVANWQSTTINFAVNAISISSGFTAVLPTSGNVAISGNLTIDSTTDSSSTSSASLVLAGGAGINKSLLVGGNLNIGGVATQFAGTLSAANSASGASVTGLLFPTATIRSFTCTISVRVVSSVNYNTQHTIEGIQTAGSGWQINDYQIGDASGITFNINSSGQITYTSPTFTSWTSTTMHFNAVAYSISSSYTPIPLPTGGSASITGPVVIQSTNIASSTSSGALSVSGGVSIQNNLIVANNFFVTSAGNVGIGTSVPNYTLDVNGTLEASNSNGLFFFASSGNIGIGTTVPSTRLDVIGPNFTYLNTRASAVSELRGARTSTTPETILRLGTGHYFGVNWASSAEFQLYNYSSVNTNANSGLNIRLGAGASDNPDTNIMTLLANGNVGIGTSIPTANLEISSSNVAVLKLSGDNQNNAAYDDGRLQTQIQMRFDGNASGFNLNCYNGAGNNMFAIENITNVTSGAIRLYIDGSGDIGLGTTSPAASLDFGSIASSKKIGLAVQTTNFWGFGANSSAIEYQVPSSSAHRFYTGSTTSALGTERVCISSTGSLLVNETSSLFGGDITRFHVKDDASVNWIAAFNHNGAGTASNQAIVFIRANTQVGSISIGGGATAYNTTSDYRLKKNITPITNALSTLEQINPVSYQWTADDSYSDGFVAHELKEVYPQAVTGEKDELYPDGSIKPQSVDYSKLVALLTAAIKELKQEFDEYKQSHP